MTGSPGSTSQTPDGRYRVVRARLLRCANPSLPADQRARANAALAMARKDLRNALHHTDRKRLGLARAAVHAALIQLGESGNVWWNDGSPDYSHRLVRNSPYREWYRAQLAASRTMRTSH